MSNVKRDFADAKARAILPGDKPLSLLSVPGLFLKPGTSRGHGKWILRFTSPTSGKRRDMGLGTYPDVGIALARKLGFEVREAIAAKNDPIDQRQANEENERIRNALPTFAEAALLVHEEIKVGFKNAKHSRQWITTLETYAFPTIGSKPVGELKASDFADVLRPIWLSKPETASRVRQRCDAVMNWCAAKDFILASPVRVVNKLLAKQPSINERSKHHPAVPWREVPALVQGLLRKGDPSLGKVVLEFAILTAARSGEARGMRWDELDRENAIWLIPDGRMKAKILHRVPLSIRALEIIDSQWQQRTSGELVFPSKRGTMISDMTLTKVLRDAQVKSDVPGRYATAHGFRSSFTDWASENQYSRDAADRALAHKVRNKTEAAYHRTDLLELRRAMMQDWASFIEL